MGVAYLMPVWAQGYKLDLCCLGLVLSKRFRYKFKISEWSLFLVSPQRPGFWVFPEEDLLAFPTLMSNYLQNIRVINNMHKIPINGPGHY